jgi:hypothetical protein
MCQNSDKDLQSMQNQDASMTKRLTISVDDDVYDILEKWADEEVRTVANLAAAIVTLEARQRKEKGEGKSS